MQVMSLDLKGRNIVHDGERAIRAISLHPIDHFYKKNIRNADEVLVIFTTRETGEDMNEMG